MEKSYDNLIEAYKNCGDNGEFEAEFKVISPILNDLPIKKVFVDYCSLYKYIDIIMNIGNRTLLTIGVNKEYNENKGVMFSISKDNKLIMIGVENIKYIIENINKCKVETNEGIYKYVSRNVPENYYRRIKIKEYGSTCKKDN